ncbi:MAG: peptidoglycan-binding protein, partial [Spirulinaceae cyanobacterium]
MSTSFQLRRTGIVLGLLAGLASGAIVSAPEQQAIALTLEQPLLAQAAADDSLPSPDDIVEPDAPTPPEDSPAITRGMEGEVVEELQTLLQRAKVYDGEVTGIFDEATEQAVADFQSQNELEPTGSLDVQTYDVLVEQVEQAAQKAAEKAEKEQQQRRQRLRKYLLAGAAGVVGLVGLVGGTYFLFRFVNQGPAQENETYSEGGEPEPLLRPDAETDFAHQPVAPNTPPSGIDPGIARHDHAALLPDPSASPPQAAEPQAADHLAADPQAPETLPPRQPLEFASIQAVQPVAPPKFETIAPAPTTAKHPPAIAPVEPSQAAALQADVWTENPANPPVNPPARSPAATPLNSPAQANATARVNPPVQPPPPAPTSTALTTQNGRISPQPAALAVQPPPEPLPKTDVIEELIRELRSPRPEVRRQAIWELAQKGDSR